MSRLKVPETWDHTCDILVVGAGTAGMPAALAAAKAGNKVTVLELTKITGGSGNIIAAGGSFAGTEVQKELGIPDSPEQYYQDGIGPNGGGDPDIWRTIADNQLDTWEWFKSMGLYPDDDPETGPIINNPGHTYKRLHRYGNGYKVMQRIEEEIRKAGAEILFEHRAKRLIADPLTDRVYGAQVETKDGYKNFKARKAVILTSGSFSRNQEMVYEYNSKFVDDTVMPLAAPGHLGDGLKMAMELGAKTNHIGDAVVGSLVYDVHSKNDRVIFFVHWGGAIIVNWNGQRFTDESCRDGFYGQVAAEFLDQPGKTAWIIYDEEIRKAVPEHDRKNIKEFKADTLEELCKITGIKSVANIRNALEKYNEDIESEGYDTVWGRKHFCWNVGTLVTINMDGPFYAVNGGCTTSSFKGGMKVNSKGQMQNQFGESIPGLYAAGEIIGGLFSRGMYLGSTNWQGFMTLGRVTGMFAAQNIPWDK
ncbi:MAG: FAD-dependent oxidoreductase [Clostridiales Family XIII bacterium]|jgi:fumarate reductase flavoprotein subunit|nr:FAD-dependent oxidoreductase [Clostridiales Family XIII bacterium]